MAEDFVLRHRREREGRAPTAETFAEVIPFVTDFLDD